MIYIKKNFSNRIILTLNETSQLSSPNYLFVFENEYNLIEQPINWSQIDSSNFTNRYNEFELIETTSGSTTGGTATELNLVAGQYSYTVYESVIPTLIVAETTGRIIEKGRMVVELDTTITDNNNNTTNEIYL
jgi:hypothetical protein